MPASSFTERIGWHAAFAREAHQSFRMDAKERGAFFGIDVGLGLTPGRRSFGDGIASHPVARLIELSN